MRVVILCGGSGSRLWPESRESLPKQFIPIFGEKTLLDLTVERVLHLNFKTKPIFVSNKNHSFLVKETLSKYNLEADIILEPEGKNTCAAIYLAAKHSSRSDNLLIMPSDHLIHNNEIFKDKILLIKKKMMSDHWITLGIKPSKASDAYGYIKVESSITNTFLKVIKFIEKPKIEIAYELIKNENYYWNAGIFIANSKQIIKSIKEYAPDIALCCDKSFEKIEVNTRTNEFKFPEKLFSKIPSRSIDFAVMEQEKNIFLYPLNCDWSDIGSWDSIAEINQIQQTNNKIIQIDSSNNFIKSDKRAIATIGIEDLIIIDSDNATLISKKNHSEKVKLVVDRLKENDYFEAKEHSFEIRPWGKFENLLDDQYCKVKKITLSPKKRLSLQYHNFRSEHWLVVFGIGNIYLDNTNLILKPGESIDIPIKSHHYIENKQDKDLIIIETQLGSYFGEDDIFRLDDPYFR